MKFTTVTICVVLYVLCTLGCMQVSAEYKDLLKHISTFQPKPMPFNSSQCPSLVPQEIKNKIQSYQSDVEKIINAVMTGRFKGKTYNETVIFVDDFGPRMSGSKNLERAIEYLKQFMNNSYDEVKEEDASIYAWERKKEECTMVLEDRNQSMRISMMGGSVSTPTGGTTGEVIIVTEINEITEEKVKDKIVLMKLAASGYGKSVYCRAMCPDMAAKAGAKALLLGFAAPFSMNTPHTGIIIYNVTGKLNTPIPVAAVTDEDADMIDRLVKRNKTVQIHLDVLSNEIGMVTSKNIYGDIKGTEKPDELMVMAAHSDSWDVGVGAMDDAGGVFVSIMAGKVLKQLNLTTKRTIRTAILTGEETGFWGGGEYYKKHQLEANKTSFMMESDYGTFKARGIKSMANQNASCIVYEILQLLKSINATEMQATYYAGADINLWQKERVPLGNLFNVDEKYYWFHHTDADRVNVLNSDEMDSCTAVFAAVSYVVAQLDDILPRNDPPKPKTSPTPPKSP